LSDIRVTPVDVESDPLAFEVTVSDGPSSTSHNVTLSRSDLERLWGTEGDADGFVRRCFEFLLQRESKESILSSFDVSDISRYFPDFEERVKS
jgi:hypothetical protein